MFKLFAFRLGEWSIIPFFGLPGTDTPMSSILFNSTILVIIFISLCKTSFIVFLIFCFSSSEKLCSILLNIFPS